MTAVVQPTRKIKEIAIGEVLKKINFKVESRSIFLKGEVEIPNKVAIYRPENERVLSVVSDKYSLLENEQIFSIPLEAVTDKAAGFFVKRFDIQKGGGRTVIDCLSKEDFKVKNVKGEDEVYKKRILLVNSYDKSSSLKILYGAFRLICSNGAGVWFGNQASFRIVHVGEKNDQAKVKQNVMNALVGYNENFHTYLQNIERLSGMKLTKGQLEKVFEFAGLKETAGDKIDEVIKRDYDKTPLSLLSVYHAVTQIYRDKEEKKETVSLRYFKKTATLMRDLLQYSTNKAA